MLVSLAYTKRGVTTDRTVVKVPYFPRSTVTVCVTVPSAFLPCVVYPGGSTLVRKRVLVTLYSGYTVFSSVAAVIVVLTANGTQPMLKK